MRILLAEDDVPLGTWLSRALEQGGIQVEWVADGLLADRALQAVEHRRDQRLPALVLTARDTLQDRVRWTCSPRPWRC